MLSKLFLARVFVLLAVVLVYANSFGNSFHFDDSHAVVDNPAIRSLGNLPRIATDATAFSVLPANQTYRPVVTASLAVDYALGRGLHVFWFHLSTFCWFLLLVLLLDLLAERVFAAALPGVDVRWPALAVVAWFGVHPAMAETVNYVIQRGDLYCTLGCVAALWLYAARTSWRRYGLYLLPFALAMLSKPPALVFPLLLLLYVLFFEAGEGPLVRRLRRSLGAALPAMMVDVALLVLQARMTPRSYLPSTLSASAYRWTQPFVWLRYAGALFLPVHLNVDTDLQPFSGFNAELAAGVCFVAALCGVVVWALRQRRRYPIAFGVLWFVLTQLPTSLYALSEVENDHRMFFSFPGLMLAVVWACFLGGKTVLQENPAGLQRVAGVFVLLLLCGYGYGAHRRNVVWRDEASLWADGVAKSPGNGRGLMNYGLAKMGAGDLPAARDLFERALVRTPNYPTLEVNLGVVDGLLADRGEGSQQTAEQHFTRAVALAPRDDVPHAFYGRWLLTHGRVPEAIDQLSAAVALNPQREMQRSLLAQARRGAGDPVGAHLNASLAAYRAGRFQESLAEAHEVLKLDPHSPEAWNNLGAGYGGLHQWAAGVAAEKQALQLKPTLAIAQNNLRWFQTQASLAPAGDGDARQAAAVYVDLSLALHQSGRYREGLEAAKRAVALDPGSAEAWNNVAANEEELHRWDEAIGAAQRALALRPDFRLAQGNLAWSRQQRGLAALSAHGR